MSCTYMQWEIYKLLVNSRLMTLLSMYTTNSHCLGTVVPTLDTIISRGGATSTVGLSYNLTCTVTLKKITGTPTVKWLDPNNNPLHNSSNITVGNTVAVNCTTYTTTLQFTTLLTSYDGQYSCQATLGAVNNTAAVNITVLSKILLLCCNGSGLTFALTPLIK